LILLINFRSLYYRESLLSACGLKPIYLRLESFSRSNFVKRLPFGETISAPLAEAALAWLNDTASDFSALPERLSIATGKISVPALKIFRLLGI